jgi:hypothetical protein
VPNRKSVNDATRRVNARPAFALGAALAQDINEGALNALRAIASNARFAQKFKKIAAQRYANSGVACY